MTKVSELETVCARCGYRFDEIKPDKQVLVMIGADGHTYSACSDCLCAIGAAQSDMERERIISECRVRH